MKTSDLKNSAKTGMQNQLHVLNEVRRCKFVSNAELSRTFKVPAASTLRILTGLESLGCIRKSTAQRKNKSVGKPAVYFEISPKAAGTIAVDVGMAYTRFAMIDYSGEVSNYIERETQQLGPDYAENIAKYINKIVNKSGLAQDRLVAVMAISGSVSKSFIRTVFLPEDYNIRERLDNLIDIELYVENDANLSTIAEQSVASIKTQSSIVCMLDRVELGTGIVIDGKLYRGFNGMAGEICRYSGQDRNKGLEDIIFSDKARKLFPEITQPPIKHSCLYDAVIKEAATGNKDAIALKDEILDKFVYEFSRLARVLDPEIFILSGEISKSSVEFRTEIINKIMKSQSNIGGYFNIPQIIFSKLGNKSPLTGAGILGVNVLSNKMLTAVPETLKNEQQYAVGI